MKGRVSLGHNIPKSNFDLDYEELVLTQEKTTRGIFEYCELQWKDSNFNQHKNRGTVRAGSTLQIRADVNTHSLNRWKNYSNQLDHLKAMLQDYI